MRRSLRGRAGFTLLSALLGTLALSATASAATSEPVLTSPTAGSASSSPLTVNYELPETARPNSVTLTFKVGEGAPTVVTLGSAEASAGEHTIYLPAANLSANKTEVKSASPNTLADGVYDVTLAYQNLALDPPASTTVKGVTLDTVTTAPTLVSPITGESLEGKFAVAYDLAEGALANSVQLVFEGEETGTSTIVLAATASGEHTVKVNPANLTGEAGVVSGPAKLAAGPYTVRVRYQDALGNPVSPSASIKLTVLAIKCAAGTFSESGRVPCSTAASGHYVEVAGATFQIACPAGTYNPVSGSAHKAACLEAEAGHFVSDIGASGQRECLAGTFAKETGSFVCTPASLGHFVAINGATEELECAAGRYSGVTGSSSCLLAPEGNYAPAGAHAPFPCAAGTSNPFKGGASAAACVLDQSGYYSGPGAAAAIPCAPGSYAAGQGSTACSLAEPGFHVEGEHAISQLPCDAGSYAPFSGATHCALAPVGTYAPAGAIAPIACPAGSEAPVAGSAACKATAPVPQPAPAVQQCALGAAVKAPSLARTATQGYSLTCKVAGTVTVGAIVTITSGTRHLTLTVVPASVTTTVAAAAPQVLKVKLTRASRKLLKSLRARVTLAITVYGTPVAGKAPRLTAATLTGRR